MHRLKQWNINVAVHVDYTINHIKQAIWIWSVRDILICHYLQLVQMLGIG